jgi:hypothetical protein
MIKEIRKQFNEDFSNEKYKNLIEDINIEFPNQLDFRFAETPIFVPQYLKNKLITACDDIFSTILEKGFFQKMTKAIPLNQLVPNQNSHPNFIAIDFAICSQSPVGKNENQELEPQLIELQGFPSLFAFQNYIGGKFKSGFFVPEGFSQYFNGLDSKSYLETMKKLLLGNENPENVILLEIFPEKQKTRIDFALTKKYWGIEPVCYTKIIKKGRKLFYEKEGQQIEIKKIYNRLIFDDLLQNFPELKTDYKLTDDVDVEWVTHPNWFFLLSKYTLPFLKSEYVPKSYFLSDLAEYPADLENYVLKPLFSFAGSGVKLNFTKEDLDQITDKENFLLQRKVKYEPIIEDTEGNLIKSEIRMLFIWPEGDDKPQLVTNLARLSRGEMIGVNFNKNFDWVGGTVAFMEE